MAKSSWPGNAVVSREAMAEGITSPTKAVEYAKKKYGSVPNEPSFMSGFSSMKPKGDKKKDGGEPGVTEILRLANLLKEHGYTLSSLRETIDSVDKLAGTVGGYDNMKKAIETLLKLGEVR